MLPQPNSFHDDQAYESVDSTLTAGLIIETVDTCVQIEKSKRRWLRYIGISVFVSIRKTRPGLRKAKAPAHQRFLKKVACINVKQNLSQMRSYFKDRAAYIPLLSPSPPASPADASSHVTDIPLHEQDLKEVARIVREKDFNALRERGGVDDVCSFLRSRTEDLAVDVGQDPKVTWKPSKPVFYKILFKACNRYAILFLLISAGLQFAIEFMKQGVKQGWHEGVAMLFTVLVLVAFPTVGNYYNERKMVKQLMERNKLVNVERSGESRSVTISDVLVGDTVYLKEGDHSPADGLFIDHGVELVLDEVLSPKIDSDRNPFLLSGSKVVKGHGRMIVTSVGTDTAFSEMLSFVTEDHQNPNRKTLLQALMDKPYILMEYTSCCVSILIAVVVLVRLLLFRKHDNYNDRPDLKGEMSMNFLMRFFENYFFKPQGRVSTLAGVLATVVIGIQHGMPLVISVALFQWKEKVVQNRAEPQNLSACVTMGLITVICIETTSEKMCNQMEVNEFWIGEKDKGHESEFDQTEQFALKALRQEISTTPANDLFISSMNTRWGTTDMEVLDQVFTILEERKWSSYEKGKHSEILVRKQSGVEQDMQLHMSGDATTILDMCSHYNDKTGESPILEIQKRKFRQDIKSMEEKGLRPIAYAYKKTNVAEFTEDGFKLLALAGLRCPYQEELKQAVETFRNAGIRIKLVSEDELSTVNARASELGIVSNSDDMALEGEAFRRLSSMERMKKVDLISVMGSSLPKDKLLMVERLKKNGHIVAFYGGLTVHDTPTLREADVGIIEDAWRTEMARENADIIIKDGCLWFLNLKSGKCAYHNIQNFCQIQLTACISGLLVTLIATMHSGDSPLTAIHLIWVNLITCLLGGLMMVMELKGQELFTHKPALRTQPLITKAIWKKITIQVSYQVSVLLILHFLGNRVPSMNQGVPDTMIFNIFTLCQVLHLLYAMELVNKDVIKIVLHSHWFLMALGTVLVMQVVIVEFGKGLASEASLNALQWTICILLAALSSGFDRAINFLFVRIGGENMSLVVSTSVGRRSNTRGGFFILSWLFLIFSVSYCFQTDIANTYSN